MSVPAEIVVAPVYELAPFSTKAPEPCLVNVVAEPEASEIAPVMVLVAALELIINALRPLTLPVTETAPEPPLMVNPGLRSLTRT